MVRLHRVVLRRSVTVAAGAAALALVLAACGPKAGTPSAGASSASVAVSAGTPSVVPTTASAKPSPTAATTTKPAVKALTCAQLKGALVGSTTLSYNGYTDSIPLGDGHWSGEDGNQVDLQSQCGIGDLNGDGAADAVGVVQLNGGGTGRFYTLVVWKNVAGQPVCQALADLDDRTPVLYITISAQKATVVWLTRTDGAPAAELNLKRTSIFALSGTHFTEVSHTDVPYTP